MSQNDTETPVAIDSSRRTAHEIFEEAAENGRKELNRPMKALAFSGFAGGMTMGLTGMAVAIVTASLPEGMTREFVPYLFYPVGFIAVIIGRAQLFTENTLYPIVLLLRDRRRERFISTIRLWITVFVANVLGASAFAALVSQTDALPKQYLTELVRLGVENSSFNFAHVFWTAVIGGWLIALVAWMVTASHWTIGQIAVVWLLTFVVGIGHFAHCIATSGEILTSVMTASIPLRQYLHWIVAATLGNILGGVIIVSLLNYGQVAAE